MDEINQGLHIVRVLKQIMDIMKQNIRAKFEEMNITGPQGMLIGILAHQGEKKISDLSKILGLSNSTVSGIVDRLEKQGFVERIRSQDDRRVVMVKLSPNFKTQHEKTFKDLELQFEQMMQTATNEEIETITKGLNTLKKVIERQNKDNK